MSEMVARLTEALRRIACHGPGFICPRTHAEDLMLTVRQFLAEELRAAAEIVRQDHGKTSTPAARIEARAAAWLNGNPR